MSLLEFEVDIQVVGVLLTPYSRCLGVAMKMVELDHPIRDTAVVSLSSLQDPEPSAV